MRIDGCFFASQIKQLLEMLMKFEVHETRLESVDETASFLSWKSIVKQVSLTEAGKAKIKFQLL